VSSEVITRVLRRLSAVYGEPQTEFTEELFGEFARALAAYRADILTNAVDRVIRDRAFPTWPTVGEVVKACREVADEMADKYVPERVPPPREYKPVDQHVAEALLRRARASINAGNSFNEIVARKRAWEADTGSRCTIDVKWPWGEEVRDSDGTIVPIGYEKARNRRRGAA